MQPRSPHPQEQRNPQTSHQEQMPTHPRQTIFTI